MKNITIRTICFIVLTLSSLAAFADKFVVDGIYYETNPGNDGTVSVVAGEVKYKGDVVIPEFVNFNGKQYKISSIGEYAFRSCSGLTSIVLPNSVTSIDQYAYIGCSNLTSIELSESLATIGTMAFYSTSKLESITLPNSLKEIGSSAFENSGLKSIHIPSSVQTISGNPFKSCINLESIVVDADNKTFDSRNNCNAIIEDEVLKAGCMNTIVPEGIITIGEYAFRSCSGLTSIVLPNSVTSIDQYAYIGCSNLTSIELSESLATIGTMAFYSTSKLESITLPNSLKEIGSSAFENSGLKKIVSEIYTPFAISKDVFGGYSTNIYKDAILYVKEGRIPIYQGTEGWKEFMNIQEIEADINFGDGTFSYTLSPLRKTGTIIALNSNDDQVTIPELITCRGEEYTINKIKDGVFSNKDVVTVSFPEKMQTLGMRMFEGSYKLSAIIWNRTDRPSEELVKSIESPNVLFYVKSEDAVPTNLTNVIVNNVAKNIVLVDAPETSFYCPQEFTAEKISYTHAYSLKTEKGVIQGWESIALPFDVQKYETADGEAKPYAVASSGEKLFWLRELTDTGFKEATAIKANVPYIISMPNWEGYQEFYNIEGDVKFSAQNVTVPKTEVASVVYGNKTFWPCYSTIKAQNDIYVLNRKSIDDNAPGSSFMKDTRKAYPFECYFTYSGTAQTRAINICDMVEGATDIAPVFIKPNIRVRNGLIYIDSVIDDTINIYSLSGKCVKSVKLKKGENIINELQEGIYIINNQKIIIK